MNQKYQISNKIQNKLKLISKQKLVVNLILYFPFSILHLLRIQQIQVYQDIFSL